MDISDLFSPGDIDGTGDIIQPQDGARMAREALLRWSPDAPERRSQPKVEYSESLRAEHESWLEHQRRHVAERKQVA